MGVKILADRPDSKKIFIPDAGHPPRHPLMVSSVIPTGSLHWLPPLTVPGPVLYCKA